LSNFILFQILQVIADSQMLNSTGTGMPFLTLHLAIAVVTLTTAIVGLATACINYRVTSRPKKKGRTSQRWHWPKR